jgi:hypothetical protein
MPEPKSDWREEALHKLADSKLTAAEREEISRELAGYLEDLCFDAPSRGVDELTAAQHAAAELHEDANLGAHLYRARKENAMRINDRTKRFWLPGMSMLLASAGFLAILQIAGFRPYFVTLWIRGGPATPHGLGWPLMLYFPWLCLLPFLGAAGTYWSRRAGGGAAVQAMAGFFCALVFLAIFVTVLLFAFVIGGITRNVSEPQTLSPEFAGAVMSWIVIPALALMIGVLPFLRSAQQQPVA